MIKYSDNALNHIETFKKHKSCSVEHWKSNKSQTEILSKVFKNVDLN